jgi:hypothetical protein
MPWQAVRRAWHSADYWSVEWTCQGRYLNASAPAAFEIANAERAVEGGSGCGGWRERDARQPPHLKLQSRIASWKQIENRKKLQKSKKPTRKKEEKTPSRRGS